MLKINKKDIQVKHFSIYSHDWLIVFLHCLKIKSIWPPPGRYCNFVILISYLSLEELWRRHSCHIPSVYNYDLFFHFLPLFLINRPYVSPSIFLSLSVLSYHSLLCLITLCFVISFSTLLYLDTLNSVKKKLLPKKCTKFLHRIIFKIKLQWKK